MAVTPQSNPSPLSLDSSRSHHWRGALLIFLIVLAAALAGIATRPLGNLAALWPANAVLLGVFLRAPRLIRADCIVAAMLAFLTADLATGAAPMTAAWLAGANLAGIGTALLVAGWGDGERLPLRAPHSVAFIVALCAAAALGSAIAGGAAMSVAGAPFVNSFALWLSSGLASNLIFLPVVLAAPIPLFPRRLRRAGELRERARRTPPAPIAALLVSVAAATAIGGPGALAIPLPAVLWCALTYSCFPTTLAVLFFSCWQVLVISQGMPVPQTGGLGSVVSTRLGVALVALGPLAVASVNAARNDLLKRLEFVASHDGLTGVLHRGAWMQRAGEAFEQARARNSPWAVLMLDVDHFKQVNDRHGHAAGDIALRTIVSGITAALRERDLVGRLGGEEFAVFLCDVSPDKARSIAERIRRAAEIAMPLPEGGEVALSLSIGLAVSESHHAIDAALTAADRALYAAKEKGRNRVQAA